MGTTLVDASIEGYSLAYREARRGLEDQERSVVELRARAGALIAAAAITTSFFGSQTLVRHDIGAAAWVAIGCFVLLGFTVLLVLWPSSPRARLRLCPPGPCHSRPPRLRIRSRCVLVRWSARRAAAAVQPASRALRL